MKVVTIYHNKPAASHEMSSNMNLYAAAPRRDIALCAFLLCSMLLASFARAQEYTITNLGSITPSGINMWGQVAGTQNGHAIVWGRWSGTQDLGTLPGGTFSSGAAINDLGVVTGVADGPGTIHLPSGSDLNCSRLAQPFIWTAQKGMEGLGALPHSLPNIWPFLCGSYTYAVGINLRSEIVGDNRDFDTYISAFRWTKAGRLNGVERLLGSFTYNSLANGINNQGHIVGESGHLGLKEHAMVVKDGVAIDLGTLAGADPDGFYCAAANGINDRGQIVGYSSLDASPQQTCLLMRAIGSAHAWAWDQRGGMRDLGVLAGDKSSVALKINYFGQVVGISGNTFTFDYAIGRATLTGRPFIWTERGGMRDLNNLIPGNSGWVLNAVSDINVWGQIIGVGTRNGESRGFLLTPKIL